MAGGGGGGGGGGEGGCVPVQNLKIGCKSLHSGHFWPWSGKKMVRPKPDRPDRLLRPCLVNRPAFVRTNGVPL